VIRSLSVVAEGPGRYIHWGIVQISVANLAIIVAMTVVFVLALVVPFPSGHDQEADPERRQK